MQHKIEIMAFTISHYNYLTKECQTAFMKISQDELGIDDQTFSIISKDYLLQ
jgi:hypothetical protein